MGRCVGPRQRSREEPMMTAQPSGSQVLALEVVAAIDAVMRRDGVDAGARCLLERRVSADAYEQAKAHWAAQIQAEREAGQSALVVAYAAAYRSALEKKHRHDARPAREPERVAEPAPASAPPPAPVQREVPTYLAAQPVLAASAPAVAIVEVARAKVRADPLDGTLELHGAIVSAATPLPFVAAESSLMATPSQRSRPPKRLRASSSLGQPQLHRRDRSRWPRAGRRPAVRGCGGRRRGRFGARAHAQPVRVLVRGASRRRPTRPEGPRRLSLARRGGARAAAPRLGAEARRRAWAASAIRRPLEQVCRMARPALTTERLEGKDHGTA